MKNNQFPIRRAWSPHVDDGVLRDRFVNAVARRIIEESQDAVAAGYPVKFTEDFVQRCDALFAARGPRTPDAVADLAASIDSASLYTLSAE